VRGLERYAPLTGVVFILLVVAAFVFGSEPPDADDPIAKVVKHWSENDSEHRASAVLIALSTPFLLWFGGALRAVSTALEGVPGRLANTAFAGLIVAVGGILVGSTIEFTTADTVGDVSPQSTQTLSALNSEFFFPMIAGFAVLLLASGLLMLRTAPFPSWLGWVTIVIGIALLTPAAFPAIILAILWVPVMGILLYFRAGAPRSEPGLPGAVPPPPAG
jgi:hypothetical protein